MGALAWVMMGIAIWHFAVFVPDRFRGGIVGAFCGAVAGAFLFGLAIHGLEIPGRNDTDIVNALEGIPGSIIGMGLVYLAGVRQEASQAAE